MDNNQDNKSFFGSIGFFDALCIVFIVLKLVGIIGWSWLWVLAPVWGQVVFAFICCVLVSLIERERR